MRKILQKIEADRAMETTGGVFIAFGIGLVAGPPAGIIAFGLILVMLSLTL